MTIIEVKKDEGAVIRLDSSELNDLNNVLCNFINHKEREPGNPNETILTSNIYLLKSNIGLARDLSHYGCVDEFSLKQINKYRDKAIEMENNK